MNLGSLFAGQVCLDGHKNFIKSIREYYQGCIKFARPLEVF